MVIRAVLAKTLGKTIFKYERYSHYSPGSISLEGDRCINEVNGKFKCNFTDAWFLHATSYRRDKITEVTTAIFLFICQ